jgi:hypothetical protein
MPGNEYRPAAEGGGAMTDEERIISRARTLMQTKGYGWSKAMAVAAETIKRENQDAKR